MSMLAATLVIVCVAIPAALAGCAYSIHDLKVTPCDGKETHFILTDADVKFNPECNLRIYGCAESKKAFKEISANYDAKKDGNPIKKGKKKACKEELWGTKIDCPMAEGTKICATEKWIFKVPKGTHDMAVGKIDVKAHVETDQGTACYNMQATVKKN